MQFYKSEWLQLLWLILFLAFFFKYVIYQNKKRLSLFGDPVTVQKLMASHDPKKVFWRFTVFLIGLSFLILALAQPQWGEEKKQLKRKGIDLLFVVDTSLSMLAEDIKPNRIEKAKFLMKSFLKHLEGDRIGMITFAGSGFLQSPLTLDYSAFTLFANSLQVGYIPDAGSNLSDGIQMAVQSFPAKSDKYKAIIAMTDGEAMGGNIDEAIQIAKKANVRIYSIGLGTENGDPIPLKSQDGKVSGYKKDMQGQVVMSKLNESLLKKIAKETEGLYFQATPSEAEVDLIYKHMQSLGKKEFKEKVVIEREDRFQFFLVVAWLCFVWEMFLGDRKRHVPQATSI